MSAATSRTVLRLPEVIERVGLSRSSVYSYIQLGMFPEPVKLGKRASGWLAEEIDGWLLQRMLARVGT